jgi:NADH dehydrogenase
MNILVVGGGFGGVKASLELAKHKSNTVTLISSDDNFQYYPTLFSTATGHDYRESWVPLETVFKGIANVKVVIDTATAVDVQKKAVTARSGTEYGYDKVIFALGSITTYFGIEGLDVYAYGIKSEDEIRKFQMHLWKEMSDGSDTEKNYVIIGGGPTGVELAGALGEYLKVLREHFGIHKKTLHISLIEAAPRLLPRLSEQTSKRALRQLKKLGVHVETNKKVEKETADELIVNGRPIKTQTVIWTSGVMNVPFYKQNETQFVLNERGKVTVDEFMRSSEHVYVIGDNAGTPYAGLAQTALHDAIFVAGHIMGASNKYKAKLPPCVIPVGHNWALFEWGKLRFGGILGHFMHRMANLIGYHDILPIGWSISAWRAGTKKQLRIPDEI